MKHLLVSHFTRGYSLTINRQPQQLDTKLHTHQFKELVIIINGKGIHFSGKDSYPIMAGDCFVVDEPHGYKDSVDLQLVNILFVPEKLNLPWNEARKLPGYNAFFALEPKYRKLHNFRNSLQLSPDKLAVCSTIIDSLENELEKQKPGFEFISAALFMELIGIISRAYAQRSKPHHVTLMGLSETISFMEQNCSKEIKISDLIRISSLSESKLLREFKKATGHTPIDYLLRLRLRNAAEILRHETDSVTNVAYRTGFNDSNYFSRQFSRIFGTSPREYRKRTI
jgi:AraC family L-rhamnose operon transcriptional activator RhaR/AraC family L-rhamnose operon regulatory protein RhaS